MTVSSAAGAPDAPRIDLHGAEAAAAFRDRIRALWPATRGAAADEDAWREQFWEQHRGRDGFRLDTATDGAGSSGAEGAGAPGEELLGFGWGYIGGAGHRLYRARGWTVLGELAAQKVVMGKRLTA